MFSDYAKISRAMFKMAIEVIGHHNYYVLHFCAHAHTNTPILSLSGSRPMMQGTIFQSGEPVLGLSCSPQSLEEMGLWMIILRLRMSHSLSI